MIFEKALILSAFVGLFLIGAYGAAMATRQSRAGRRGLALVQAVPAAILLFLSGFVLVIAAAWSL